MSKIVREHLYFSKREKRGIVVLIIVILIGVVIPKIRSYYSKPALWDYSEFEDEIDKFTSQVQNNDNAAEAVVNYFYFDPNTLNKKGFQKLGLSDKQIATIFKYRKAGGVFYKSDDFSKIYGITPSLVKKLTPYIQIKTKQKELSTSLVSKSSYHNESKTSIKEKAFIVELNAADSLDLLKVNGIGPVFASRIINYRNYLGGFYNVNQLTEVYGLSPDVLKKIQPFMKVDSLAIEKINLNTADFKTIIKHPYLSYAQTKAIVKYKTLMGSFNSISDIIENHLVDSGTYKKVYPYLLVN